MNSDFGFHQESSSLLILTVGTGTSGTHSNLAQGLVNTLHQLRPRLFWLVPSASEKSTPVADLIRETVADLDSFAPLVGVSSLPRHSEPRRHSRMPSPTAPQ
ncbi:MAG: hypothetical protein HY735_03625 [Verrucomicrobia bacterium]|nr:hypothetical protein [Verrucomicrobiota bacterium]